MYYQRQATETNLVYPLFSIWKHAEGLGLALFLHFPGLSFLRLYLVVTKFERKVEEK